MKDIFFKISSFNLIKRNLFTRYADIGKLQSDIYLIINTYLW